jgi:7,8-dihydro-6-hydroxymethylpterin dimethyltransferase
MESSMHSLNLNDEHVHANRNTTLDDLGIAKTAREEKLRARDAKQQLKVIDPRQEAENARMMALYKEHVLGEKQQSKEGFVPLGTLGIAPASKKEDVTEEVAGD